METIRVLLETQVLFTLFLTIAVGYLVGEINIKGFSLGSGAVLFVGLAIGGFAPKAAGVKAILPHVDSFRAAHSIASLEALGQALSRPGDTGERDRLMALLRL